MNKLLIVLLVLVCVSFGTVKDSSVGSAITPNYTFTSDTNTGMYRKSADVLGFTTGGVNRVTVNAQGIQTTTVNATKFVGDGTAITGLTTYINTANADLRYLGISNTANYALSTNHALTANYASNIPVQPTYINTANADLRYLGISNTANYALSTNYALTANNADLLDGQHGSYYQPVSTAVTTNFTGGVSVSATVSANKVYTPTITDGIQTFTAGSQTGVVNINASGTITVNKVVANGGNIVLNTGYLSGDGGNEGVYVSANGNVGIGTTAPSTALEVAGTVSASALVINSIYGVNKITGINDHGFLNINSTNTSKQSGISFANSASDKWYMSIGATPGNYMMSFENSMSGRPLELWYTNPAVSRFQGSVGIGTSAGANPSTALEVAGTVSASSLQVNGVGTFTGTVSANSFKTMSGSTSLVNGVATTINILPTYLDTSIYVVSAALAGYDSVDAYSGMAFIMVNATKARLMQAINGTQCYITVDGTTRAIRVQQSNGSDFTYNWSITRLNN